MKLTLKRVFQDQFGTHGELWEDDKLLCYTEELPYLADVPNVSCVDPGIYNCSPHNSENHPHTWQLDNTVGRTNVLIHNGNTMKDTLGCILVGLTKIPQGVSNSIAALGMLRKILPDNFTLEIIAAPAVNSGL